MGSSLTAGPGVIFRHPLTALRSDLGVSAPEYLHLLDTRYRELGLGTMATRREKVYRWEGGSAVPGRRAQLAMASLHGVPAAVIDEHGWPNWLLSAFPNDNSLHQLPWTLDGTHAALLVSVEGGPVDRRTFLTVTGAALTGVANEWAHQLDLPTAIGDQSGRRRLTPATLTRLEARLEHLRHLDDVLGGGELLQAATTELQLLARLAKDATYDEVTGRRLHRAIAEAARICGWVHYDAGLHAAAQSYYVAGLRTSATANDPVTGANILAFMAIQAFTVGDPRDAVHLLETAQDKARARATPRVQAFLHTLAARAVAQIPGAGQRCERAIGHAHEAFDAGVRDDDPEWIYWLDRTEVDSTAASCALDIGRPAQALVHFAQVRAVRAATVSGDFARDTTLGLLDEARAHLSLHDIDTACSTAQTAASHAAGVESGRVAVHLTAFRDQLAAVATGSARARQFLEATA